MIKIFKLMNVGHVRFSKDVVKPQPETVVFNLGTMGQKGTQQEFKVAIKYMLYSRNFVRLQLG